jgi:phosphatidylglycerophosphatase A
MDRFALFIATCGYVGYIPVAPGTFGSAAGLALLWAIRAAGMPYLEIVVMVALFALGAWSGTVAERHAGTVDPGYIVMDEVVGMFITMALIPATAVASVVGFLVFRALDILKPWPARTLERLPGGWGVMADDAMAAVYANLLMHGFIAASSGRVV